MIPPSVVFNVPEKRTLSPIWTFEGIESKVRTVEYVVKFVGEMSIIKEIYVPGKLVNFVVK